MRLGVLSLIAFTGCVTAKPVSVRLLCPPGTSVTIAGQLKGVGQGSHLVTPGTFVARCGDYPELNLEVRAGSAGESFDFRGLDGSSQGAQPSESLFDRTAPATVLLIIRSGSRASIGSGVIVSPEGLVVTNRHVVKRTAGLYAFLHGDTDSSQKTGDLGAFWRFNEKQALKPKVLRRHPSRDLALLQLPPREKPYPFLKPALEPKLKVGARVIAVGSPDGLAWSMSSGTISALRKDWIQHQAPINPGNSGGPLIDDRGRLIGINTQVRNRAERRGNNNVAISGLGFALPSDIVHAFIADEGGEAKTVLKSDAPKAEETGNGRGDSELLTHLLVGAVRNWSKNGDRQLALRAACDVLAATASNGRAGFLHRVNADWINEGLAKSLAEFPEGEQARVAELMPHHWPRVLYDAVGQLWLLKDGAYHAGPQVSAWSVDDVTGQVYFAKKDGSLWRMHRDRDPTNVEGLARVADVQASDGMIFVSDPEGRVFAHENGLSRPLGQAPVSGFLLATRGYLYLLDRDRDLFAYHHGAWDNGGQPIARNVIQVTAQGRAWYGLDAARRVYSGNLKRYIDNDGDAVALRAVNDDLLLFNDSGKLYRFEAETRRWSGMVGP